jgi:TonB family protein
MFGFRKGSWQDRWPHHKNPYLRVALIVAGIHLLLFVFAPPFHFKPYRLEAQEITVVENVPDFEPPEPIPEEPKLPVEVEPAPDDLGVDLDPPWTSYDDPRNLPLPPIVTGRSASPFVHFDKDPVVKRLVMPAYPVLAREAGLEGVVVVRVRIDESGKVVAASVVTSDVDESMNRAALAAALACEFEPAMQGTRPVTVDVEIPFEFRLE